MKNTGNTFADLSSIDVTPHLEYKQGLSYLQWMACWSIIKLYDPKASFKVIQDDDGHPFFTTGAGAFVITELTINGETQMETLPVLDYKNKAVLPEKLNTFDINSAYKRCLVKNAALFGLGSQVYINGEGSPLDLNRGLGGGKKPMSNNKKAASASISF